MTSKLIFLLPFLLKLFSSQSRIDSVIQANYRTIQSTQENFNFWSNETFTILSNKKTTLVYPLCEQYIITDNRIEYSNCILTLVTDFNILKGDITVLTNTGVIIDISIEKMIYTGSNEIYHLDISGDTQIYMNTNRAFMRSGLFSFIPSILPSIKNNIIEHYLSIVNSKYTPNETINKKDELNAILSLLFMRQPYYDVELFDTEKISKVTYFNYLSSNFDCTFNMRESTRIGRLTIVLEYSVNFNLNYQEAYVYFDNFYFSNKVLEFEPPIFENVEDPQEKEEIKSFLENKVKEDLISSKKSYYNEDDKGK